MKNNSFYGFLVIFIMTGLFSVGCASNPVKPITDYQTSGVSMEQHARVFIDAYVQVIGVDGKMSPLKYIAKVGNVILLAPGQHRLNINSFDTRGNDWPRYPGHEMAFSVEAGKYYRISSTPARARLLEFYFEDIDNPLDASGRFANVEFRESFKAQIEKALNK